ncbi:hypothetical protein NPIL_59931 [Nephila pilipes]|uniref:Uncharacterized protein n=1 Tax=Nephila pilipes TaxID=299642 RepID=A0A8X6N631_NEPPI|nr:hypothetical protein NPIL_59931 [Nephila pilipes]
MSRNSDDNGTAVTKVRIGLHIILHTHRAKSTAKRDRKPPKFGRAGALRERRASHARRVLQTYPQHEIENRRSLGGPKHSENHDHRSPEKSYEVHLNARSKAADV